MRNSGTLFSCLLQLNLPGKFKMRSNEPNKAPENYSMRGGGVIGHEKVTKKTDK